MATAITRYTPASRARRTTASTSSGENRSKWTWVSISWMGGSIGRVKGFRLPFYSSDQVHWAECDKRKICFHPASVSSPLPIHELPAHKDFSTADHPSWDKFQSARLNLLDLLPPLDDLRRISQRPISHDQAGWI